MHMKERTLVIIKPEGMKRGLADRIIKYYEAGGLRVVARKQVHIDKKFAARHYEASDAQTVGMGEKTIAAAKESGLYETMKKQFGTSDAKRIGTKLREWLIDHITSSSVVAIVLEGENAVKLARQITGFTDPARADKGTVRGDLGDDSIVVANREFRPVRNLVHCADEQSASRELKLWFPELK